jgi:hypothetical protein
MTSKIVNPRFDNNDVKTGWSGTGFNHNNPKENAECYAENYDIFQKIEGLPRGIYAVGVKAFYLPGEIEECYRHYKAKDEVSRYAKLYAEGAGIYTEATIVNVFDTQRREALGYKGEESIQDTETGLTYWIPYYSLVAAERYMHELDGYNNRVLAMVDGSLTLGVKKSETIQPDWSVFDDFSLTYYGDGADACQLYLDEARREYDSFSMAEGVLYTKAYLEEARRQRTATTMDEIKEALDAIKQAYADLQKNISLWKEWKAVTKRGLSLATTSVYTNFDEARQLADYCSEDAATIAAGHSLTNQELTDAISKTNALIDALYNADSTSGRMLVEGKKWAYSHHRWMVDDEHSHVVTQVTYTLHGDTVIDGRSYKKLYQQEEEAAPVYSMALREETRTVYCYWRNQETRCIEFNPSCFSPDFMEPYLSDATDEIDVVTVNGRSFVRHNYSAPQWDSLIAVEGIGYEQLGILGMHFAITPNDYLMFDSCYEDGECIFTEEDFLRKGDEPAGLSKTKAELRTTSPLFDLQGRPVVGTPKRGIYVKEGRKYVVK